MKDKINNGEFQNGSVSISEEVISTISNIAANEVEGVAKMSGGITSEITEKLGMKNLSKGVAVAIEGENVTVNMDIAIEYGNNIKEVAEKVQKNVKENIETMTGMVVTTININILEVVFPKEKKENIEK